MGTKVTDLTELATAPASDDVLHIVDVSDTTGGADGTSKKIQVSNLPGGGGGSGTVTSVGITDGTGITSSGGPITTSGNITVGISAGGVDTNELANDAVTQAKIDAGAVGTTELDTDSVSTAKIQDEAVDDNKLADDAVQTSKIADDAVTGAKLNAELADLSNVASTSPTNEQVLTYNSSSSEWEPRTSSGGGGSTTVYSVKTFAFFDSSIRDVYLPMSSESETTSIQRYNRYVCTFDGEVDTISFIGTANKSGGTGGSIVVRKITSGTNTPVDAETVTFASMSAYVTTTLTFSSSSAFSAGDVLVFWMTNGFSASYSNITGAIKFKLT